MTLDSGIGSSAKRFLGFFMVLLFLHRASLLGAYSLQEQVQAGEGYDIFDSLAKTEHVIPAPSPRMSNNDLYRISEYVLGQGYRYFAVLPKPAKEEPGIHPNKWQFFLEGQEVEIVAYDSVPKNVKAYVWDAKRFYRWARYHLGYRDDREKALKKINEELGRKPENVDLLSQKAAVLAERARYERKGIVEYFNALKTLMLAKMKRGDLLDLDKDLNPFMEVAVCADRETEYLDALTLLPPAQVETRKLARKRYDNKKLLFADPEEKKELCRTYGDPPDESSTA